VPSVSGTPTAGNVASFSSGSVIQDSKVPANKIAIVGGTPNNHNITMWGTSNNLLDTGIPVDTVAQTTGVEMTGPIDAAGILELGTASATGVQIGRNATTTQIYGVVILRQSFANWYSSVNVQPSFVASVYQVVSFPAAAATDLVDFTHGNGTLTYTGTVSRKFKYGANINVTFASAGTFRFVFNVNPGTPPVGQQAAQTSCVVGIPVTDLNNRKFYGFTDQIFLNPGDTLSPVMLWTNTSATDVTVQRVAFVLEALLN
jgi:hypothetical protein